MMRWSLALSVVLILGGACSSDPAQSGADGGAGTGGGAAGNAGVAGNAGAAGSVGFAGNSGTAGKPGAAGSGGAGSKSLDECFVGLRAGVGDVQLATKTSADGTVRYRIALETADRFGTSGGKAWAPYRLAIETPGGRVCITDETVLAAGYVGSHHNCQDRLIVTAAGQRYEIDAPDSGVSPGYAIPRMSALSVFTGATRVLGPVSLTNVMCTSNAPTKLCTSGGPC
jgi:hypothetical protein